MNRLLIGETLLDQFRIENFIAAGGMATIYRVWDLRRGVPLAMKVLQPELASDPAFIARFTREARALESLSHPHIVPFYGMYQAGDLTFLLEQYIDGPSLDEVLRRMGGAPVALREALVYFKGLYTSLGYGHAQGIIHCDVKPGNVLIDQGGRVYLTDFGIARYAEATGSTSAIGTPIYMAPEQIRGERAVPETDVYSLGVLMYELLTGRRPFRPDMSLPTEAGTSAVDRLRFAHLNMPPPDPRELNPNIPPELARVVLRAMAKDPAGRYPSMQAMAEAVFGSVNTRYEALPDRVTLPEGLWAEVHRGAPDENGAAPAFTPYSTPEPIGTMPAPPVFPQAEPVVQTNPRRVGRYIPRQALLLAGLLLVLGMCGFAGFRMVNAWAANWPASSPPNLPGQPSLPALPLRTPLPAAITPTETTIIPNSSGPGATPTPENAGEATTTPEPQGPPGAGPLDEQVNGVFLVVQNTGGRDRLYVLDTAQNAISSVEVYPNADWAWSPQWSPDGQKITWVAKYDGGSHILVQDVASGTWQQLAASDGYESVFGPTWLSEGTQVAFWAAREGRNWVIIADAATGQQVRQIELPGYRNLFVWNWSTGQVAFARQDSNRRNQVVIASAPDADGVTLQAGDEAYAPAWSRDGQWLAFQGTGAEGTGTSEIFIARADGTEMRQVTSGPAGTWSRAPTWSPDGRYIAYVSNQNGGIGPDHGELFIVEVATGRYRQATSTGGTIYDWRPDWKP